MYNFTQFYSRMIRCCFGLSGIFLKSIMGLGLVMLFLLVSTNVNAQAGVPCIDGDSGEWQGNAVTGAPTFELKHDVFIGNDDDIFTGGKDFKSWGQVSPTPDYSNWTFSPMQAKSDIMNAAAVIYTGITGAPLCSAEEPFDEYDPTHTYLFFAGDRESNNGTGYIGFWFLLNGSAAVDAGKDKYFSPDHYTNFGEEDPDNPGTFFDAETSIGDLLVLADFTGGGRNAAITVLKWVGPGNGNRGNNNSLYEIGLDSQVGQNNAGPTGVPSNFVVPEGQIEYDTNEFYEGVIDITDVFDLQNNPEIICGATWMLETRSSDEITADSKDFVGGNFNLAPVINVSDDEVCVNGSASLTATVSHGNMVVEDPKADGYTFVWSGPGSFTGQGTATITFDPAQLSDDGDYSVMVTSPNGCPPADGDAIGTLTINDLPVVTPNNASLECTETMVQLTASPSGGTWSGDHVSESGLFDATGLAPDNYTVTYTYTDGNGCTNSADAIVTVNIAPDLTINCPNPVSVDCNDDIATAFSNWLEDFTSDGGGGTITETYTVTVDGNPVAIGDLVAPTNICDGSVINITFMASDECDQEEECSSSFTLEADTTPPTASNPANDTVDCGNIPNPDPLVVIDEADNCGTPTVQHLDDTEHPGVCGGSFIRTYRVTDSCGQYIDVQQTINVNPAPQAAFVEMPGDTSMACDDAPPSGTSLGYSNGATTGACEI
ncbi:hypothetical protein, partial [Aestuariivivens marinum]|uniref:hypothetical protein n=1 Tax=Aestuariivivens marinum TaxID=2913555 RepID=UPI001F564D35